MEYQRYRIAVLDDAAEDRVEIVEMTAQVCREMNIEPEIFGYERAKDLLKEIYQGKEFDLLLFDVMIPEQGGMALARCLRERNQDEAIVFISNNREMALRGYEVAASRYLAKPLRKERLKEAVEFCYRQKQADGKKELVLPVEHGLRKVFAKDICYVEINGRKCRIVQEAEEWDSRCSMKEMEKNLSGQKFIRCHQSFLVNCRYIRAIESTAIELTNGRKIPVSKHRIKNVKAEFLAYVNC